MADYPDIPETQPVAGAPAPRPREVRLRIFRRRPKRSGKREESFHGHSPSNRVRKSIRQMIDQVNRDMEKNNIPIHLVLIEEEKTHFLDIYDCSDGRLCKRIKEDPVTLEELPRLIRHLQLEAGLLFDTVS